LSILITNFHTEIFWKHKLIDFVIQFLNDIATFVSENSFQIFCRMKEVAIVYRDEWKEIK